MCQLIFPKNNFLIIDCAIGINAFINFQTLSPNSKAIVIPCIKVISSSAMVKGGIKIKANYARALSDHYFYIFSNGNHIYKASKPSILNGRSYKLQLKSKDKAAEGL
jgi:hypothetical protein